MIMFVFMCSAVFSDEEKTSTDEKGKIDLFGGILEKMTSSADKIVGPIVDLETIILSSDRIKEPAIMSASSIAVVSDEDIERQHITFMKNILAQQAGISEIESGPFGGQATIRMRGANPNNTLLMIDNVKIYDPTTPDGAFNFANLSLDNVEQIEVVKGPQSTLYGSDAIGGMINVVSKKPNEPFFIAGFEAGSFHTFNEFVNLGGYEKGLHYSFGFSQLNTKGISSTDSQTVPNISERDPYRRSSLAARADYDVTDNLTVGGTVRYMYAKNDYDDTDPVTYAMRDNDELIGKSSFLLYSVYVDHKPVEFYDYSVRYGCMNNFRENFDFTDIENDWFEGTVNRLDFQNNLNILEYDTFTIGYEHIEEISDSYSYTRTGGENDQSKVFSRNDALYLQNKIHYKDILGSTLGMRVDHHSQFGTHATYKIDGFYLAPSGTRLRGVFATGFKAPSLFQLHAPANLNWSFLGGNPDLKPEKSVSYEMGIDQYMFSGVLKLSATYFQTRFYDLVKYSRNPTTYLGTYENAAKAKSLGMEFGAEINLFDGKFVISANYGALETKDYSTDREMARVPKDEFNINVNIKPTSRININANIRHAGVYFDIGTDKIKPYTVVGCSADFNIAKNLSVFARIDNLFNKHYQEVRGYSTVPFSAYGGAKINF